ncbi:hypothetical protein [Oricola thermophila]|uniref:Uncharacterized protein n=1 Tax=Oricola thermophila TaxID=2742145 RepID=A0A6N1VM19_9HYPH|nr:hypothetical protein [Oricola thermophila]QKV20279.1 hypothetical protein HTY61_18375 [Oricola thermophila]
MRQLDILAGLDTPEPRPARRAESSLRDYTIDEWAARKREISEFVEEMRPTALEPFARLLDPRDYSIMITLRDMGHFMQCPETGRWFCPSLTRRG